LFFVRRESTCILIRHALRTSHLLERLHQLVASYAQLLQGLRRRTAFAGQGEKIMFRAGELVLQLRHLAFGRVQRLAQFIAEPHISPAHLRTTLQFPPDARFQISRRHAEFFQQWARHPIGLLE
jgi:hypothetical protein